MSSSLFFLVIITFTAPSGSYFERSSAASFGSQQACSAHAQQLASAASAPNGYRVTGRCDPLPKAVP